MTTTTVSPRSPDARAPHPAPGAHPAVPAVPRGAVGLARAAVARALLSRAAARVPIRIQAPDGRLSGDGGPRSPVLVIRDQDAFYRRLGSGTAGLAEAYMTGAWDCDDLPGLFTVLAGHVTALVPAPLQALRRWYIPRQPAAEDATIDGAGHNIQRHYDLSDDLFAAFLDPSMSYSSALFAPGDSLAGAQRRKIDALLDRTGVGAIGLQWQPARPVIDGGMAAAIRDQQARRRTLTVYTDLRRVTAPLGISDRNTIWLFLTDRAGRMRWRGSGGWAGLPAPGDATPA